MKNITKKSKRLNVKRHFRRDKSLTKELSVDDFPFLSEQDKRKVLYQKFIERKTVRDA